MSNEPKSTDDVRTQLENAVTELRETEKALQTMSAIFIAIDFDTLNATTTNTLDGMSEILGMFAKRVSAIATAVDQCWLDIGKILKNQPTTEQ